MRRSHSCVFFLLAIALTGCGTQQSSKDPTLVANSVTTLVAQTANNTSAANSFPTQINGNLGANNVSKLNLHSLLYPGNKTKILAQLLVWFGQSNHIDVGYSSTDPAQVKRQITDMVSRGIDGVIVDWYGPGNSIDEATKLVMKEAEKHPGFSFTIMIDQGAMGNICSGCPAQEKLTQLLKYVEKEFFPSPAYLTLQGQPVVTNFNIDYSYSVDWHAANAALSTPPRFLFQDNGGFTHPISDGSYSWVMPWASDYGLEYLSSFYQTGLAFSREQTMGAIYKGFNDALAA